MSGITHVFFDLHGTLVDGYKLHSCYSRALGGVMATRYGGDVESWAEAHRQVFADWDSYYTDLDLTGEDGLADMWEGMTRILRAMFRLTGRPYLLHDEMQLLVRDYHYPVTSQCDELFPDAREALWAIHEESSLTLGVISDAVQGHSEGILAGAGVRDWFTGPVIGPDVVERFGKDAVYFDFAFMRAGARPETCVVVDDALTAIENACRVGARTVLIDRQRRQPQGSADENLPDLRGLPDLLRKWGEND